MPQLLPRPTEYSCDVCERKTGTFYAAKIAQGGVTSRVDGARMRLRCKVKACGQARSRWVRSFLYEGVIFRLSGELEESMSRINKVYKII